MSLIRASSPTLAVYAVLTALMILVPGASEQVAFVIFYIVLAQAYNIFMGFTGYVNFGYSAFLALGAYGMALGILGFSHLGFLGFLIGVAYSVLITLILGAVLSGVALRLRGAYFAIATIGVNEGFKYFILGARVWGGADGLIISSELRSIFGRDLANFLATTGANLLLVLVGVVATIVTAYVINARIGYALGAIREDEDAAKVMGVNTTMYKTIAFLISSILAGLIGAFAWALKAQWVLPETAFSLTYTVEAIAIVMLGGAGTLLGPLIGGIIYGVSKYYLATIAPGLQLLILAPILIAIVVAFPFGVTGYLRRKLKGTGLEVYLV